MTSTTAHARFTHQLVLRRALTHLKALKRRQADYEEQCRRWWRQGYAPHYCIHGTNLWTEYDNICGPCEEGLTAYEIALAHGYSDVTATEARLEAVRHLIDLGAPRTNTRDLAMWAVEPITREV